MSDLYDTIGRGYGRYRRPDPRIAAQIHAALGQAVQIANIRAGAGAYEPVGRRVTAIEPSQIMIDQRAAGLAPCVRARAEALPFADNSFDAALASLSTHHWQDVAQGLREMRRVTRGACIFLDHDPAGMHFWLLDEYFPDLKSRLQPLLPLAIAAEVFTRVHTEPVPVPRDCTDGFLAAYWARPQYYLKAEARGAISAFATAPHAALERGLQALEQDLASGAWNQRHRDLAGQNVMDLGYRLVIARR